jgi:hypothetical protein
MCSLPWFRNGSAKKFDIVAYLSTSGGGKGAECAGTDGGVNAGLALHLGKLVPSSAFPGGAYVVVRDFEPRCESAKPAGDGLAKVTSTTEFHDKSASQLKEHVGKDCAKRGFKFADNFRKWTVLESDGGKGKEGHLQVTFDCVNERSSGPSTSLNSNSGAARRSGTRGSDD